MAITNTDMKVKPLAMLLRQINLDNNVALTEEQVQLRALTVLDPVEPQVIQVQGESYTINRNTSVELDILTDEVQDDFVKLKYQRISLAHLFSRITPSLFELDVIKEGALSPIDVWNALLAKYEILGNDTDFVLTANADKTQLTLAAKSENFAYTEQVVFIVDPSLATRIPTKLLDGFEIPREEPKMMAKFTTVAPAPTIAGIWYNAGDHLLRVSGRQEQWSVETYERDTFKLLFTNTITFEDDKVSRYDLPIYVDVANHKIYFAFAKSRLQSPDFTAYKLQMWIAAVDYTASTNTYTKSAELQLPNVILQATAPQDLIYIGGKFYMFGCETSGENGTGKTVLITMPVTENAGALEVSTITGTVLDSIPVNANPIFYRQAGNKVVLCMSDPANGSEGDVIYVSEPVSDVTAFTKVGNVDSSYIRLADAPCPNLVVLNDKLYIGNQGDSGTPAGSIKVFDLSSGVWSTVMLNTIRGEQTFDFTTSQSNVIFAPYTADSIVISDLPAQLTDAVDMYTVPLEIIKPLPAK